LTLLSRINPSALAPSRRLLQSRIPSGGGMKHYRVNKVTKPGGTVVKKKDILAAGHSEAVARAEADEDCPICEVWHEGRKIGSVL
jgi:hypothetical protein